MQARNVDLPLPKRLLQSRQQRDFQAMTDLDSIESHGSDLMDDVFALGMALAIPARRK
jgi:hypothetical protein